MKNLLAYSLVLLSLFASTSAWASSYYASLTTKVANTGGGKVYASTSNSQPSADKYDESSGPVQSASTSTSGGSVNLYAFAKANDGYEFKGWATSESGATSYASTDNPWTASLAAATSDKGIQAYTYYAYFEKQTLQSFSITYLAPNGGSYTVDGTSVGSGGLVKGPYTEAYTPKLAATAADGYAFNGWYTTADGGTTKTLLSQESPYTASFIATTTVCADFVPCVKVTTATELTTSLANDYCIEIPAGTTISLDGGTLAANKTLIVNGELYVSGTFTNNGTITGGGAIITLKKLVTQTGASGDTPFETTCVVASYNKKYYKTSIGTMSGAVSGTAPGCAVKNGARVVRNGVTIAQCVWPTTVTPAVLCCTVDPTKAVNCITGFLNPCYDTDAAKGMATMQKNNQLTKQMLVLLTSKELTSTVCSNAGIMNNESKLNGNFGTMDLAESTLTVNCGKTNSYSHVLLNGKLTEKVLLYNGTITLINCTPTFSSMAPKYNSVINLYDCTISAKFPTKYDTSASGSSSNTINFYSTSGSATYSTNYFQTDTSHYKIYGGRWTSQPDESYIADAMKSDYAFYQTSDTDETYSLKPKTDQSVVTFDNGNKYESLADAFTALSGLTESSVKMTMLKNATLASAVTIPVGKTVEIELNGMCITVSNGFVVNNGTFRIGDNKGNIASTGGRVITSSGNFLVNNGTAEITYGYYTGDVVLNGGELTTHYGRFTGNFSAATGVDKTEVANFRGGYFDKDVSAFLRSGYMRTNGYVGVFPRPVVTMNWNSSGYWKCNAKLLSDADKAIYVKESSIKDDYPDSDWKRRGELISMITPYGSYTIDVAVGFNRYIEKTGVKANISKPSLGDNELTKDVEAGGLFRVLSEQLANPSNPLMSQSYQVQYSSALRLSTYQEMEFGVYSSKDVDKGTTANLRIDLCMGANVYDLTNLRSVYSLVSEYVVIGAGKTNQAMIQPESGAATFYETIAKAVEACPEGGTIKLCNNITAPDTITISKAVTIDTNGMEFNGTIVAGDGYKISTVENVLAIEKYIGKVHRTYTVTTITPEEIINNTEGTADIAITKDTVLNLALINEDKAFTLNEESNKVHKISWVDNGKYLACGTDGVLTVMSGSPANGRSSFESYVLGLNAADDKSRPYLKSIPNDDKENISFKFDGINPRVINGVTPVYKVEYATSFDFTNCDSSSLSTSPNISVPLPTSGNKVMYYRPKISISVDQQ